MNEAVWDFAPPRAHEFAEYMMERHAIYHRRRMGMPYPWSEDPAMRDVYLTNVFRELDRVTVWVKKHVRDPFADHPNLWLTIALARYINLPSTLEMLLDKGVLPVDSWEAQRDLFVEVMKFRRARGLPLYTNAYIIWTGNETGLAKHDLVVRVVDRLLQSRESTEPRLSGSLEEAWTALSSQYGIGGFTAYEIVTDLRHTRYLRDAPDIKTWAHAGPGAKQGLNWIFGRTPTTKAVPDKQALKEMRAALEYVNRFWPYPEELEMREIEHSLCEFSKISRLRHEGRSPKRYYKLGAEHR